MNRPELQGSRPDAEDEDLDALVGEDVEDPFADTWPDDQVPDKEEG